MIARRGSILLLVLVVIAVSALIVASALRQSLAAGWTAASSDRQLESRLAAWSGIEMVMTELQSQRSHLLTGNSPILTDQIVVQSKEQGSTVVRLVPFGPDVALSENAKLPLNTAVVEWLAKLPGLDLAAATAIDTHRCRVAFGSIDELQLLGYDPADLDPSAPRLRVMRNGVGWELRDDAGMLLSTHPSQGDAIDRALERSRARFSEILVRGSSGETEWAVAQDPLSQELARVIREQYPRGGGAG